MQQSQGPGPFHAPAPRRDPAEHLGLEPGARRPAGLPCPAKARTGLEHSCHGRLLSLKQWPGVKPSPVSGNCDNTREGSYSVFKVLWPKSSNDRGHSTMKGWKQENRCLFIPFHGPVCAAPPKWPQAVGQI